MNQQHTQDSVSPRLDKAASENTCSITVIAGRSVPSLCLLKRDQENVLAPVCDSRNMQEYLYSAPTFKVKSIPRGFHSISVDCNL